MTLASEVMIGLSDNQMKQTKQMVMVMKQKEIVHDTRSRRMEIRIYKGVPFIREMFQAPASCCGDGDYPKS